MHERIPDSDEWLSDDPLNSEDPTLDLLERRTFAKSCVIMLERLRVQSESSVVALIGPWGAGKSSVLNMIRSQIKRKDLEASWSVVEFNPWNYQDLPSLQTGFFSELQATLPAGPKWKTARDALSKIGRRVAPLGSLGSFLGFDAEKAIEAFTDLISGDESLAAVRQEAEDALRSARQPLLVMIDDLDRLAPEELLLVFKLIRLTGRLPHIYYLISYDEDTLLDALSRTGLVGRDDPRRAVDYLEKIVQIRLDLPPLREYQVSEWVDNALNSLAQRFEFKLDHQSLSRFSSAYHAHIRTRLNTPRSIKRYFSQVEAFLEPMMNEVDIVDFLLISWIRTAEPLVYELIAASGGELLGKEWSIRSLLGKEDPKTRKQAWRTRLTEARVAEGNIDGLAEVLGQLFSRFDEVWKESTPGSRTHNPQPGRISHPNYFDRFFAFGVPPEDIPDVIVSMALDQIAANRTGVERSRVESEFVNKASMIVEKLEAFTDANPESIPAVINWLTLNYHHLDDLLALVTPRHHLRWATARLFMKLDCDSAIAAMDTAADAEEGLFLAAHWIHAAAAESNSESGAAESFGRIRNRYIQLIHRSLDGYKTTNPLDIPDHIWALIWEWRGLEPSGAATWVKTAMADNDKWPVLDVVARFVSAQAPLGTSNPEWTLDSLDMNVVDELLGLDFVFDRLQSELAADGESQASPRSPKVNPLTRRSFALRALEQERVRRASSNP